MEGPCYSAVPSASSARAATAAGGAGGAAVDPPLTLRTDGQHLVIARAEDEKVQKKLEAVMAKGNKKYAKMFQRLAR